MSRLHSGEKISALRTENDDDSFSEALKSFDNFGLHSRRERVNPGVKFLMNIVCEQTGKFANKS